MNVLPPKLFLDYEELYLKVRFDNGDEGTCNLTPYQRITSSPHALVAEVAKFSELAKTAEGVKIGAITRDMLSSSILNELNATLEDQNGSNILSDIDRIITYDRLAPSAIAAISITSLSSITDGKIKIVLLGKTTCRLLYLP